VVVVVVTADSVIAVAMVAPTVVVVAAMAIAVRERGKKVEESEKKEKREINKGKFLFAPFAPGAMKDRHRTGATIRQTEKKTVGLRPSAGKTTCSAFTIMHVTDYAKKRQMTPTR